MGKTVTVACASPVKSDLIGADKIQAELATGGDNLVISFPYSEGSIDKVDYGVQGNYFNIIITPRSQQNKIQPQKVKYSYAGGAIDFIFIVDAPNLNSLGTLYAENQTEFGGKTIINIDRHLVNDQFGTVNVVNKTSSSTSELVLKVLQALQIELDKDIATNLYAGLAIATNNFTSYSVNADSFEAAAVLLKAGAVKRPPTRPGMPSMGAPRPMGGAPMPSMRQPSPFPFQPRQPNQSPMTPQPPMPPREQQRPIEDVEDEMQADDSDAAPQDWLKPKIFRGGGLV
jgi:hypothetical protein